MHSSSQRDENVQILRFIAAGLVLITHISFYYHDRLDSTAAIWDPGVAGVSLFFVISGFVMHVSSARIPRDGAGASYFLRRRIARIVPMYWLITTAKILIVLGLPGVMVHHHPTLRYALASYALIPTMDADGLVRPIHGVGWTLYHEMYFYYLFALALLLRRSPLAFCGAIIGGAFAVGLFVPPESAIGRTVCNQINLLFVAGVLLGHMLDRNLRLPRAAAVIALCVGGAALLTVHDFAGMRAVVWRDFGAVSCVFACASLVGLSFPFRQTFVRLGDSSYSLYLIHPLLAPAICVALWKAHAGWEPLLMVVTFTVTVIAGQYTYRFIEDPMNRLARNLLLPRRSAPAPSRSPQLAAPASR